MGTVWGILPVGVVVFGIGIAIVAAAVAWAIVAPTDRPAMRIGLLIREWRGR